MKRIFVRKGAFMGMVDGMGVSLSLSISKFRLRRFAVAALFLCPLRNENFQTTKKQERVKVWQSKKWQ